MPKRISAADATPIRVVIVTMDSHLAGAAARAQTALRKDIPQLELTVHAADKWGNDEAALACCHADIARGDIVIATMLFLDDHIRAILPALQARRKTCDAMVACMSAGDVVKLTRLGRFNMAAEGSGVMSVLKRLRGSGKRSDSSGHGQMKMLRQLPKFLRFIPGTAQDMRAYFLTLQYWLGGSEENIANMVRLLVDRYSSSGRPGLRGQLTVKPPINYPDVGVYHPRLKERITDRVERLPSPRSRTDASDQATVGLLVMRSYLLAGNAGHYDGVIASFEERGLKVIPAFASGLDARPAIERYFMREGRATVDAVVSLTGFSLVGGPAYNDARAAEEMLAALDVPYLAAHPAEFQTLEQWGASTRGLMPVESAIMVAIPELDGATGPLIFGGRSDGNGTACTGCERRCVFPSSTTGADMHACADRCAMLTARTEKLITLRRGARSQRKVGVVLFNFPPNAGNVGTAAYLSVFESLHRTLSALKREGYSVGELPCDGDALRESILEGNARRFGADANVHARISANDHVRRETWLKEIEAQWGRAPGRQQSDGSTIFILGKQFGNVFVGVQPALGYEGDPMRLLFENGFTPTHAFSAFYRWLREDFRVDALLHFGTHGALEFMPGKQTGMSGSCWPDRLIGSIPNIYLYASNNPSEGTLAKRRSAATLVSYMTPPVAHAGLYRGLVDLKASVERWRALMPEADGERTDLAALIQSQASSIDLGPAEPAWSEAERDARVSALAAQILELEYTLIPHGLHVVGEPLSPQERVDMLLASAEAGHGIQPARATVERLVAGEGPEAAHASVGGAPHETDAIALLRELAETNKLLAVDHEIPGLLRALDGRYVRPAPGGDLLRTPAVLPTGRNLHGFDPFRIPSAFAVRDGARQAERLLDRHMADGNELPESIALVLWGTDNLKSEGAPIAQAMALLGTRPRFDGYGRLAGAELIPLAEMSRPRIDVIVSLSGIFRDLLPMQVKLLAEGCYLAATADESLDMNFVRKHALAYQRTHGCDIETAALRIFGNADGAYGANVNHMVDNGQWRDEDELAETYARRKSFAYGRTGAPVQKSALLASVLADVDLTYQNLDSVELGVTTIDHYFDTLGGMSRAVRRAKGGIEAPVYIGDQTRGEGLVRTLSEQVSLETRTRMLNPKWYEGMLKHGYEGVRQLEEHVTNTMGWSATTGQVAPWVYKQLTQTFVLDRQMRERLAELNPVASAKVANRLIEAHERQYWKPDTAMLDALRRAGEELEDRIEGIGPEIGQGVAA
jgi:magnesium chelatase subunit H